MVADEDVECVLLIVNCERYAFKAARQMGWIAEAGLLRPDAAIRFYHVRGDVGMCEAYRREDGHVLRVRAPDDYVGLPSKMRAAFAAVRVLHPGLRLLMKTDDDQLLTPPDFLEKMRVLLVGSGRDYGGHIVDIDRPYLSKYHTEHPELPPDLPLEKTRYCSGRFYFLSRAALDALADLPAALFAAEYLEDYAVGRLLPARFKTGMIHIPTERYFFDLH